MPYPKRVPGGSNRRPPSTSSRTPRSSSFSGPKDESRTKKPRTSSRPARGRDGSIVTPRASRPYNESSSPGTRLSAGPKRFSRSEVRAGARGPRTSDSSTPTRGYSPRPQYSARPTAKPTRAVRHAASAAAKAEAEKSEYPMRINKYLAQKGYATRKAADELIEKRRVYINNKRAVLGDKVLETDTVDVRIDKKNPDKKLVYFAYNKPRSVITHSAQDDESEIREMVPELVEEFGVFPVGRLDKDSHGLIILTNDGRVTDRLLSPVHEHEKEYVVKTKQPLRESFKEKLEAGVNIEGYQTKPAKVQILNDRTFRIIITEGKKHQIRRMVVALFNEVEDLERIRIMGILIGKVRPGEYRPIEGEELSTFLKALGL